MNTNSIQSNSSQVVQSNQNSIATLQKEQQKILDEIKQLQSQDVKRNEKPIQSLQQQTQNSNMESSISSQDVGPAYTLHLGEQNNSTVAKASNSAMPIEEAKREQQPPSSNTLQNNGFAPGVGPAYIVKLEQQGRAKSNKNPDATTSETI